MTTIRTIGELKKLLENIPDDIVIGGYSGNNNNPDYVPVGFELRDRSKITDIDDWEGKKNSKEMIEWWDGPAPDIIFICDTDW